ncbi:MAG: DNA topoisomerase VI subunit B, partial [Candidatus Aenigmarchaeota archaeon]|nr:DNA topoisomerase VI subunit B [Candidatus Aenigmarchaeota archaeon]
PHPYGVELGIFLRMLKRTKAKTISSFLINEFSSIGAKTAEKACKEARIKKDRKPQELTNEEAKKLLHVLQSMDIQRPPLDCLSPIGEEALKKGLLKHYPNAEFIATVTREPNVYRGNPFQVEAAIVYDPTLPSGDSVKLIRFANKAPLLYQQGACAIFKAVVETDWKRYGLDHRKGSLPTGPFVIVVHLASVWVPFISEGKEAIANYPIIIKEIKLALQKVARKLAIYLSGKRREHQKRRRFELFQRYAPEIGESLSKLTGAPKDKIIKKLDELIRERIKIEDTKEN